MCRSFGIIWTISFHALDSRVLHNNSVQSLGLFLLDIHGLNVAIQLLLSTFLVVTLAADSHTESEGDAFDAGFPDFLVELWV